MPDYVKAAIQEEKTISNILSPTNEMKGTNVMDIDEKVEVENVERPVDLYKVFFSNQNFE